MADEDEAATTIFDEVKHQSARELVGLVFGILGGIASFTVARWFTDPEYQSHAKMWSALRVAHAANRASYWLSDLSAKAVTVYNKERP